MLRKEDKVKEQIRFNTEMLKLQVVVLMASFGGTFSLLRVELDQNDVVWGMVGVVFSCVLAIRVLVNYYQTKKIIRYGAV